MFDTFDPRACASGPACVQALRQEYEIRISQRLGVRLLLMARRGIQVSPALLEEATPGSELERCLLDSAWNSVEDAPAARALLAGRGCAVQAGRLIGLGCVDEAEPTADLADDDRVESHDDAAQATAHHRQSTEAPLTALAVVPPPRTRSEERWDARGLQRAAVTYFDSENPAELVERLRQLFRTADEAGVDPVPLLAFALALGKAPLAHETAALVRDHLDRDTGRALEDLASDEEGRVRDAVHFLLRPARTTTGRSPASPTPHESPQAAPDASVRTVSPGVALVHTSQEAQSSELPPLAPLVLPALTPLLGSPRVLRLVLTHLGATLPLLSLDPARVEPFLDALLDRLTDLEAPERFTLSRFLIDAQGTVPTLPGLLLRRLRATVDPHQQAFYGNLLARVRLGEIEHEQVCEALVELFLRHGQDVGLSERLKATFALLGARPLERLTQEAPRMPATMQRGYLVDLWAASLRNGTPHPPLTQLAAFMAQEIGARNRVSLRCMIRASATGCDMLLLPELKRMLDENDWLRATVIATLLDEAITLEEPDDLPVLRLLSTLGREAVEAAFERTREEAALDARAAPHRCRVFAYIASRAEPASWLCELVETALAWTFLERTDLPVSVRTLGLLGRVPGLPKSWRLATLDRLVPAAAAQTPQPTPPDAASAGLPQGLRFPEERLQAVLDVYESGEPSTQEAIEERIEQIVAAQSPPRLLLGATLNAIDALFEREDPPRRASGLATLLARTLLRTGQETSLEHVLTSMLAEDTAGAGVQVLLPWSKEDRDHALVILGKAASHARSPETLHRMIVARLAGFLEDWLDAHEHARNLYAHRDTPLWQVLTDVLDRRPSEYAVEAVVRVGLRTIEVARRASASLALERREEVQRLLARLVVVAPADPVVVRGSLSVDLAQSALHTLLRLAAQDSASAYARCAELWADERMPSRLRPALEAFFRMQRGTP